MSSVFVSCDNKDDNSVKDYSAFKELVTTRYYKSELFSEDYLKIYGKWRLSGTSGGYTGGGTKMDFDYLEIRKYGIYGFVKGDTLLEYGRITLDFSDENSAELKINFEEDKHSNSFFSDKEKYVKFSGNSILNLNSPCCDRFHYRFQRAVE